MTADRSTPPLPAFPLAGAADAALARLASATGAAGIAALTGAGLLGERAMLMGLRVPGRISAGGGCRLYAARDDHVALNLARPADRELLPALFSDGSLDADDDGQIAARIARLDAVDLVARGRSMGLAIAAVHEAPAVPGPAVVTLAPRPRTPPPPAHRRPRILDLSALWAGPLAAHLLWLAGAQVIKVESRTRPDAMRSGQRDFYALLNQGKRVVALDPADPADRDVLLGLIGGADIVIEAARPRALRQLGIDAAALVLSNPGLVWLTITAHGATGEAAGWVGFGDDVGIAAGLGAALRAAGRPGFVGDAIADPLTGIHAAGAGWRAWRGGHGGRYGIAMRDVTAACLMDERARDPERLTRALRGWAAAEGSLFPSMPPRPIPPLAPLAQTLPVWPPRC